MSLKEDIRKDMFNASKSSNTSEAEILKIAIASIKNEEIATGESLSDEAVIKVLRKEAKKIEDSISEFTKMGRTELAEKEQSQLVVLNRYLPALMNTDQIREVVIAKIAELGVSDSREMGRVMGVVMKELNGKADGNEVRNIVQQQLA